MKLIKKSILILYSIFLNLSPMIAQTNNNSSPTDFGTTGETAINPNDSPTVPIDNCLILIFTIGMFYAFSKLSDSKIKQIIATKII